MNFCYCCEVFSLLVIVIFSLAALVVCESKKFFCHKEANLYNSRWFLPARRYDNAVLAVILCFSIRRSVRPSVCLSVTSQCSTKTAKPKITQTMPHDSPGIPVCRRFKDLGEILARSRRWGDLVGISPRPKRGPK